MKARHGYGWPFGLALLAVGLFIRYHIGRRRFNRRGIAGLPQFSCYRNGLLVIAIEKLCMGVANLCLIAGCFLLAGTGCIHFKF